MKHEVEKILVTGGAGFVGSHVAEFYLKKASDVIVFDNLSRARLLGKEHTDASYNWNYLKSYDNVRLIEGDVTDFERLKTVGRDVDIIIHTAAQTAVTTSLVSPETDFRINVFGTFNVLEFARRFCDNPAIIFCSTNKVYGSNVNDIRVSEKDLRHVFENRFKKGVSETFSIDLCEHTPYGCSKLAGDLYTQDYGQVYGIKSGVFRMSCIYGPRQFGVEDQGWVAWFAIATITGKTITVYGDGKQLRDILYVDDLIRAFDAFLQRRKQLAGEVFNIGGGPENTMSLLELLQMLEQLTGKRSKIAFSRWRPSDQKVYISNVSKAKEKLQWSPKVRPKEGVRNLVNWVLENKNLFEQK